MGINKLTLKFTRKSKGPIAAKTKRNKVRGLTIPDVKIYYVVTVIKTV